VALPFTSLDDLINSVTNGQTDNVCWFKNSVAPIAIGVWHSTWAENGVPGSGSTDSGGTQYVNGTGGSGASANVGGFGFNTINLSPQGRIATASLVHSTVPTNVVIADRLCAIGPISVTTTGSKTLTTMPALPRYTNGLGVECWLEVTTAFTVTAGTFFLNSYTDPSGNAGQNATSARLATAISATIHVGDMIGPFPLLPGDNGLQAVASFDVNTAPTVGAVNVVLLKRLPTMVPVPVAGLANTRNLISQVPAMPVIPDGSTLFAMYQAGSTAAPLLDGNFVCAYK